MLSLPEEDIALLTQKQKAARIHVSFMGQAFQPDALKERLAQGPWARVIAFRPTGTESSHFSVQDTHALTGRASSIFPFEAYRLAFWYVGNSFLCSLWGSS